MSLKNFSKIKLTKNSQSYWKLYRLDGSEIIPFTEWTLGIQNKFSFSTRDKYTQVVSKFIDYLVEVNIFEQDVTRMELKQAVDGYKQLLSYGKSISENKLNKIANTLNFNAISPSSWANNIAAINSFLKFVAEKEDDEREYLNIKNNIKIPIEFRDVLPELNRIKKLNTLEKQAIKQKSFIANLYRKNGEVTVIAGLKSNYTKDVKSNLDRLDFPSLQIPNLLRNATCFRDRAIYALMAGTGLRSSEVISLTWDMIDIPNQKVYILNQNLKNSDENIKFKGRNTIETFFIPELRHVFFQALYEYQLKEADNNVNHNYVFQYLTGQERGDAYYKVSRQGFIKEFKKTVTRAQIPSPVIDRNYIWTPHSLRHFYGVYMLNYIPISTGYGFSIEEVQRMMGHKSVEVTKQYARRPAEYIQSQLEYAELRLSGVDTSLIDFNKIFSSKMMKSLDKDNNND
jgi:integrase